MIGFGKLANTQRQTHKTKRKGTYTVEETWQLLRDMMEGESDGGEVSESRMKTGLMRRDQTLNWNQNKTSRSADSDTAVRTTAPPPGREGYYTDINL